MTLKRIDPNGLAVAETYSHVVLAAGSELVFVAGQVAEDEDGSVIGRDEARRWPVPRRQRTSTPCTSA